MRQDNIDCHRLIEEMRQQLHNKRRLRLESFMLPEESPMDRAPQPHREAPAPQMQNDEQMQAEKEKQTLMGVQGEINQIRQIALKTISRLSDCPTSESYNFMKKIWNMCDKAMEPAKNNNGGEN